MKRILRRAAAFGLALGTLLGSALALTPEELGVILRENYAGEVPRRVWAETTVEGMLSALGDPFTRYYTPQGYEKFREAMGEDSDQGASVSFSLEEGHIGVFDLRVLGGETYGIMKAALEENDSAADRWIIDARENRGGEMKAAVDAVSVFGGSGRLAYFRDHEDQLFTAKAENSSLTMDPVIVVVGGHTASGGELLAASIRDRQAGLIVGSRTYGKGVAQTAFDKDSEGYGEYFSDGSALLLTTDRFFSENYVSNNILVEEDMAPRVARLLCASAPRDSQGYLRIHLARWRWYVNARGAEREPLKALLEALPPQAAVYEGAGGDSWEETTAAAYGKSHIRGFSPRTFGDLGDTEYAEAIDTLKTYGMVKGNEKGEYDPGAPLTRASLCALLAQAMGYPMSKAAPAFADTPEGEWYTPYVTTLAAMGIVNGYDDGLFHPHDPIPHQQFMTILARIAANTSHLSYAAWREGPSPEALASGSYDRYDSWARPGAWLLDGSWHAPAGDIDPLAPTTRGEAAYDLWAMLTVLVVITA